MCLKKVNATLRSGNMYPEDRWALKMYVMKERCPFLSPKGMYTDASFERGRHLTTIVRNVALVHSRKLLLTFLPENNRDRP
jgi:hypothetical protein